MAILLSCLAFLSIYNFFSYDLILRLVFILVFTLALEYLLWKIRGISPFVPSAGIITALIIFLLFDNISPFYYSIIPITVGIVQKQFLRIGGKHIFNPAIFGLFAASLVGYPTFWWGVSWGIAPLLIIIIGGIYVTLFTLKQAFITLPYIATSVLIYIVSRGISNLNILVGAFIAGSFWFFTFVMLPEPITAPQKNKTRIIYAMFVALLPLLILDYAPGDAILFSLLLGNGLGFLLDKRL